MKYLILDLVTKHILLNLAEKSAQHMLDLRALAEDCKVEATLPPNTIILKQTNQLRAMTTIIRDKESESGDFIFYLERTASLVLERYRRIETFLTVAPWMSYLTLQRELKLPEDIHAKDSSCPPRSVGLRL
jgi:hypothetical protein